MGIETDADADSGRVLETQRLVLRKIAFEDDAFILELLNEPSFLRYIGDRGVRCAADARRYIEAGPMASYARHGFGLFLTELKGSRQPLGMCGLLKRDSLDDVDLGFALVPRFWSQGYAFEASAAVLNYARRVCGVERVLAIASPDNAPSIGLLAKLGFRFERMAQVPGGAPEVKVFVTDV